MNNTQKGQAMGLIVGILLSVLVISLGNHIIDNKMYDFASLTFLGATSTLALTMFYLAIYPVAISPVSLSKPEAHRERKRITRIVKPEPVKVFSVPLHDRLLVDIYDDKGLLASERFSDVYKASEFYYSYYMSGFNVIKNFQPVSMEDLYIHDTPYKDHPAVI